MKSFDWKEFKRGEIAVHCDTEEKAIDFLKECDKQGIKWEYGTRTTELSWWEYFNIETIYVMEESKFRIGEYTYAKGNIRIIKWAKSY